MTETTPGTPDGLARFGHHLEPAIDFCIEVESLESIVLDKELGLRSKEPLPIERYNNAMDFRVGGDEIAVRAKLALRELGPRLRALSTASADNGLAEGRRHDEPTPHA